MLETVIGFLLFSSMMLLYLPAYYNEMQRMDEVILRSKSWQLFSELVDVQLDSTLPEDVKAVVNEELIDSWESLNNDSVLFFGCEIDVCQLSLGNGSEMYIEIQELDF